MASLVHIFVISFIQRHIITCKVTWLSLRREWTQRFAVALVVRGLLIVTSHTNYDVTSCPVIMRRYANADGDEQRYKTSKTQVSLAFCKIVIVTGRRGRATACTTRAVPESSTNHSSADRIVVNSYNFTLQFIGHVITYPCWDDSYTMIVKGASAKLSWVVSQSDPAYLS